MLGVTCLAVLAPLLSLRDLGRLGPMSSVGVGTAGFFAASVVAVTGIAMFKGQLGGEPALPGWCVRVRGMLARCSSGPMQRVCESFAAGGNICCCPCLPLACVMLLHVVPNTLASALTSPCPCLNPAPCLYLSPRLPSAPPDFHWLPTDDMMGSTPTSVLVNLLAVLPVISLSFVCQ